MTAVVYEFIEFLKHEYSIEIPPKATKDFMNSLLLKSKPSDTVNDLIIRVVCNTFDVTVTQINSRSRKREIANAKHAHRYFLKNFTDLSLIAIGNKSGGYDHSTVLHSIDMVNDLMFADKDYKAKIFQCSDAIRMGLDNNN